MAISPSGMDYFRTEPEDVVVLDLEGRVVEGRRVPSSEVDMHRVLYAGREDVGAVVHTHSTCATTLACLHEGLPPEDALCLMLAHGFLHLLAWDHDTEERESAMWARQDAVKQRLLDVLRGGH